MPRRIIVFVAATIVVAYFAFVVHATAFGQTLSLPAQGTVKFVSNLRSGPDTTFSRVGQAQPGDAVQITDCNDDCTWYQLADGPWIAARLVQVESGSGQECDPSYPSVCIPPAPPDLDCNEL